MKKLPASETEKMPRIASRAGPFFKAVCSLQAGESLLIEPHEWKHKYSPTYITRLLRKKNSLLKYSSGRTAEGWVITRLA